MITLKIAFIAKSCPSDKQVKPKQTENAKQSQQTGLIKVEFSTGGLMQPVDYK